MATQTNTAPAESAEWIREKNVTKQFGIGRQTLRKLRERRLIEAVSLQEEDEKRGIVLYNVASIRAYIVRKLQSQAAGESIASR